MVDLSIAMLVYQRVQILYRKNLLCLYHTYFFFEAVFGLIPIQMYWPMPIILEPQKHCFQTFLAT